jgi:hypothetical protein
VPVLAASSVTRYPRDASPGDHISPRNLVITASMLRGNEKYVPARIMNTPVQAITVRDVFKIFMFT